MPFYDIFYDLCRHKGKFPATVCRELEFSPSLTTKWKKKGTYPSTYALVKLADYFDCSTDYLLGRSRHKDVAERVEFNVRKQLRNRNSNNVELTFSVVEKKGESDVPESDIN